MLFFLTQYDESNKKKNRSKIFKNETKTTQTPVFNGKNENI